MTARMVSLPAELAEQAATIIEERIGAASDIPAAIRTHIRAQVPHPVAVDLRELRAAVESGTIRDVLDRLTDEPDLRDMLSGVRDDRIENLLDRVEGHGNQEPS